MRRNRADRCLRWAGFVVLSCVWSAASARDKTDLIVLNNGDRVTGEILELQYGQLKVSTDDMGTIAIEWSAIASIKSQYAFDVEQIGGYRSYGVMGPAPDARQLIVGTGEGETKIDFVQVTRIAKLESTFWSRIDGSFSIGYNYAKSTEVAVQTAQFNATYRAETVAASLSASVNSSRSPEEGTLDRDSLAFTYRWLRANRNFWAGISSLERNEELGIESRLLLGGGFGRYVYQTPYSEISAFVGAAGTQESVVDDTEGQTSLEGILGSSWRIFKLNTPKSSLDSELVFYPSLSDWGRYRGHADVTLRHEVIKDFFIDLSFYYDYDSEAPGEETTSSDDYGITTSIGYSF